MPRKLKTAQSKVEHGFAKFENKLKKVLSLKGKSSTSNRDESCAQDVHPVTAAPQNSPTNCTEQAPAQNEPSISSDVSTERSQSSTNISHTFPATPPKPAATLPQLGAQDTHQEAQLHNSGNTAPTTPQRSTNSSNSVYSTPTPTDNLNTNQPRNKLNRSTSLPAAPSSPPTTPASSTTFLNTPCHSLTSPFPTPIKPRQPPPKYKDPSGNYQNALAEYIQDEESRSQKTDWAALVQWITSAHRAEITELTQKHAVEVQHLCRDRDQLRGQLEMQSGRSVEAMTRGSEEGVLLGFVYSYVVLGIKGLAWFLRRPETFY
ncbi:hypothetical protein BDR22DRAFT_553772 [Usnea florida]